MKRSKLDNKFRHHKWFKEGVTVRYALDYFAKNGDVYLSKKPSKKQSMGLFDTILYDDILTDGKCSYKLTEEEKNYYLERKKYWKTQKELEYQQWLKTNINIEDELKTYLMSNTHYDLESKERQLQYCINNNDSEDNRESILFWEEEVKRVKITKSIIENLIQENISKIKTNQDFENFKKMIDARLEKVVRWNENEACWELINNELSGGIK